MVTVPRKPRATYAEIEALPPNVTGEILDGELHVQPRPASPHTRVASKLGVVLGAPYHRGGAAGPGGWIILDEPELHMGPHVIVPDLAGWRRTRMPEEPETAFIDLAPDWVAEISSPSTRRVDYAIKRPIYAAEGVRHLWQIEPADHMIQVFRLENGHWILVSTAAGDDPQALEPFDDAPLDLAFLWSR